ncbi:MAG: cell division protein FtsW [Ardenticatenaceae bacterium]|nr:cell division protein FtsW [Ardenticatenaceae bacterium]MCB9442830.1 cell division protein FtsW [Ardenticatenaceae bacterium]
MASVNVIRKRTARVHPALKLQFDYWMLLIMAGLLILGMLIVYSSTFWLGIEAKDGDALYYIRRQFVAFLLGGLGIIFIMQFDYHILRRFSVPVLIITLLGLIVVLFFGEAIFGARRGISGGSYQPSEIAKLATFIYIAHWLSSKGDRIKDVTYGLIPFSVITGVVCSLIILQPDLGTSALIAMVSFTLFFVAGADWRQFMATGALGGSVFFVLIKSFPHAAARLAEYLQTLKDPSLAGWQVRQAFVALGRGGVSGVGLGAGIQKYGALPAAHTDGVFAILGEELGLFGTMICIILLALLVWRGLLTAWRARDSFGGLLALGITCWIGYQSLMNIAVITAVMPFTGIPLPFMSYGGSSLLITLLGMGILLNISRDAAITQRDQPQRNKD